MAQIDITPERLRQFESELREIRRLCSNRRSLQNQQVEDLKAFWDDGKYQAFVARHTKFDLALTRLEFQMDHYSDFLRRKAAAADAFLGR
ncbi:hypothetical protein [Pararhodobacter sp. SW119]|uniref:hypothetical protein n=1 Tax=Pararhodobacter sp. SW119 TaxID=2780075 RepID=UPI001AE0D2D7|nr:hypothetical protein [Pararhodobacter sp. SW119]